MINPKALETFGKYDKKSLMAGIAVGQGLKGRARAAQNPAPAGFPQDLWDAASQRANAMIARLQAEESGETPSEPETPEGWTFDKDAFCFGVAAGRSLEGWEIDGFGDTANLPDGWAEIMYYVHVDSAEAVVINFTGYVGADILIDWGDGSQDLSTIGSYPRTSAYDSHNYQSNGDYIITLMSNNGLSPRSDCKSTSHAGVHINYRSDILHSVYLKGGVSSIGQYAFYRSSLINITMSEDIVSSGLIINDSAFSHCASLISITIPSGSYVRMNAFNSCTSLADVTICDGDSITTISDETYGLTHLSDFSTDGVFFGCTALKSITIPGNVKSIGGNAFARCTSLTDVTICDGLTEIYGEFPQSRGDTHFDTYNTYIPNWNKMGAFSFCSALERVTIPESVTRIGTGAFCGCSSLKNITIPNAVTSIGACAFYGCAALESVAMPNYVTTIGTEAFFECTALKNITIPESVTYIGYRAFVYCRNLTSVIIPDNAQVGWGAFINCSALTNIQIGVNVTFDEYSNSNYPPGTVDSRAFGGCVSLTSVKIPEGATRIPGQMFRTCSALTSVTIPASVISIGVEAFLRTGLTSVTINRNATVGANAFPANCTINYY